MRKPSEVIEKFYNCVKPEIKFTFIFTFLIGLFTHLYMLTNKLPNYDDIRTFFGFGVSGQLGRWGLAQLGNLVTGLDLCYSVPMINGLTAIMLMSLTACVIVELFDINDKMLCALCGGGVITFPALTCTFFFMFTVSYYALAILLAVMSVYVFVRCKNTGVRIVLSTGLLIGSISIYQAYFPLAASLYIILLLIGCMEKKNMLITAISYGIELVVALLGYLGLTRFYCLYTGTELSSYHGISNMGNFSLHFFLHAVKTVYEKLGELLFSQGLELNFNLSCRVAFLLLFFVFLFLWGSKMIELIKEKKLYIVVQSVLFLFLLPICVLGIYVMCPLTEDVYSIMLYPVVMFLVCAVVFVGKWGKGTFGIISNWLVVLSSVGLLIFYFIFANIQYMCIDMEVRQAESYFTTMITQIKSAEGYQNGMKVIFIGDTITDQSFYGNDLMASYNVTGRDQNLLNIYCREYFMRDYLGFLYDWQREEVGDKERNETADMACYPDDGSIRVIEECIFVKLE